MSKELSQVELVDAAMARLQQDGLDYGSYFPMALIKELAGPMGKDPVKLAFFKMSLSESLLDRGFHISEANLNGEGMRICQAVENFHVATGWLVRADRSHARAQLLLEKTDQSRLTDAEKQRDANLLREIQHRRMMLRRQNDFVRLARKHKPALLKEDVEMEVVSESSAKVS
jgi:hypothetical protein